jgi:hypothetical protein
MARISKSCLQNLAISKFSMTDYENPLIYGTGKLSSVDLLQISNSKFVKIISLSEA